MTARGPAFAGTADNTDNTAIAVVGLGCRYPDASGPERLWELVLSGRRAFRPLPPGRLSPADYHGPPAGDPDTTYLRYAGVLDGWAFDRARFRVPGPVYRVTDLTHWLALEVAADTLAAAGFPDGLGLPRDRTGVIIGNTLAGEFSRAGLMRIRWPYVRRVLQDALIRHGYDPGGLAGLLAEIEHRYKEPFPAPTDESLVGGLANAIAGRICNHFDLGGGGFTVDGACSSSLLAVTAACAALHSGDLDFALAGGVDLSLDPFELVGFARVGALATEAMRVFDARPTGFLPGEGCGMAALMRAGEAAAAGCVPLAVIRGWGVSSDGRGGLTRPESGGQLRALRRAYARAGFGPETVALFEGHGTGTEVGDRAELTALVELHRGRRRADPAAIGSVKANIGHTKAAAGIAGLIKAAWAVHQEVIPPTTGCVDPHELLRSPGAPLRVVPGAAPWPDAPRRAAVSSMGFGGINAHVVLEGAPAGGRGRRLTAVERRTARGGLDVEAFVYSAASEAELADQLDRTAARAATMSYAEHIDLAASLAAASDHRAPLRAALVAADPAQLAAAARQARELLAGARPGPYTQSGGIHLGRGPAGRVGLLFPGQGSPVQATAGALGRVFPQAQDLWPGADAATPVDTAVAQPAVFQASVAALRFLDRLGVRAVAAAGHSLGEITALCWAGALAERHARDLVAARGQIMAGTGAPGTGMASIGAPAGQVAELVAGTGLVVAADNGPAVVVAGTLAELDLVLARAGAAGLGAVRLKVSHAFHSPAVAAAGPALARRLDAVPHGPVARRLYSTVTGRALAPEADLRELLVRQLTSPVLFREAVEALAVDCDLLVETGPGHALTAVAAGCADVPVLPLAAGAESARALCDAAGALFAVGAAANPGALFAERFHRPFDLWREPAFLTGPCESAPVVAALPAPGKSERGQPVTGPAPTREAADREVAAVVRTLLAEALELPSEGIGGGERLLGDLHLGSLRAVQLAAEAARRCGRAVLAPPPLAEATVDRLIAAIEALPPVGRDDAMLAGAAEWHRIMVPELVPAEPAGPSVPYAWRVHGQGVLRDQTQPRLNTAPGAPPAAVVFLPEDPDQAAIGELLTAAHSAVRGGHPLTVVDLGDTASGFLGSLAQEHALTARWIRVLDPAAASRLPWLLGVPWTGFAEIVLDSQGRTCAPGYRPAVLEGTERAPRLGPGDVLLVTGGGKGIGFESAAHLGRRWGVALGLIGRSDPAADPLLRANLDRLRADRIRFRYVAADVTDADRLRRAVAQLTDELGPIAGVLHCSGVNRPGRFTGPDPARYAEHAAPKHRALRTLVAALDPGSVRLLVTFGSVIGRFGLAGQAHYALANGRLRELARVLAGRLPECLVRNVDWSVWSGAGMAERLDVLDSLRRSGVAAVPVERGVELLASVAEAGPGPYSVLGTGRLPQLDRAAAAATAGRPLLGRPVAHTPGVELVTELELTAREHAYLADHRIDGLLVVPAVVVLETMAQAGAALTGRRPRGVAAGAFDRPFVVPDQGARTIRVCASARADGDVDVVVRSDETGFDLDHFAGTVTFADGGVPPVPTLGERPPEHSGGELYGALMFHGPRFQRLLRYEHLEATACTAVLSGAAAGFWEPACLGDPARNDASIHVLQGCVPHRRLLPVGCDRFAVHDEAPPDGAELALSAAERSQAGPEYVYDVVVRSGSGAPVLSWTGLRLRDVGPLPAETMPPVLARPFLERGLAAILPGRDVRVRIGEGADLAVTGAGVTGFATAPAVVAGAVPGWAAVARELSRLTGEPDGRVQARLRAVRQCLPDPEARPAVRGVYEGGWVRLLAGASDVVSVVLDDGSRPVAVAVAAKEYP